MKPGEMPHTSAENVALSIKVITIPIIIVPVYPWI